MTRTAAEDRPRPTKTAHGLPPTQPPLQKLLGSAQVRESGRSHTAAMNLRSAAPVALAAAAIGGAGGALVFAVADGGSTKTTTIVQQSPLAAPTTTSSSADGRALTPREIYKRDSPGVVFVRSEVVQRTQSPF